MQALDLLSTCRRRLVLALAAALASAPAAAVAQPVPAPTAAETARFLHQATFGPTHNAIWHVQTVGFEHFLLEQQWAPSTPYPDLAAWPSTRPATCTGPCARDNYTMFPLQAAFFQNALYGSDQLRQRVAFALSQILVVSGREVTLASWMRPYQQLLYEQAFGNYRDLLRAVTLNPGMGNYLDMTNSRCQTRVPAQVTICRAGQVGKPNENYPREVLQLFSVGLNLLQQDGRPWTDGEGRPLPTYTQQDVEEFARVFTGWVQSPALSGPPDVGGTVPNYRDPLRVHLDGQGREDYHDRGTKTLLNGLVVPAGQSASDDLTAAIGNIASHPNVAPFIGKQLIQHLVTSNPSPEYVARISAVFSANAESPWQLFEVARAILLDPEARSAPVAGSAAGHLKQPVLFMSGFLRMFGAASFDRSNPSDGVLNSLSLGNNYNIGSSQMSQDVFNSPSVFNFYPPDAPLPGEPGLVGPEFRLYSSSAALRRANFVSRLLYNGIAPGGDRSTGTSVDLSYYLTAAANPDAFLADLNILMVDGLLGPDALSIISTRIKAIPASRALQRVQEAIYLVAITPSYQVER